MPFESPRTDAGRALLLSLLRGARRIAMYKLQALIILALLVAGLASTVFSCSSRSEPRSPTSAYDSYNPRQASKAPPSSPAAPQPAPDYEARLRERDQRIAALAQQVQALLRAQQTPRETPEATFDVPEAAGFAGDSQPQALLRELADLSTPALKQNLTTSYDNYFFELKRCERFGNTVKASLTIRNDSPDSNRELNLMTTSRYGSTSFYDTSGDEYTASRVSMGREESSRGVLHRMPSGLPVKVTATFENIPPHVSVMALFSLNFWRRLQVEFNAIPITLPEAADGAK